MKKAVSFVATASNSGKTTLIEKVVAILKSKGLNVAVVKHASAGFELDKPGKDSWRFRQAGADTVILVGPDSVAFIKKIRFEPALDELEEFTSDADIVIIEGFKKTAGNRIEVFRQGVSGEQPLCLHDPTILALASDKQFSVAIPQFNINDAEGVAAFLIGHTLAD